MTNEEYHKEYARLAHAIQSGVMMNIQHEVETSGFDPIRVKKHLRTGLNLRATDHAALVSLLLDKGIITEQEYYERCLESLRREVAQMEAQIEERLGGKTKITLA